MAGVEKMVKTMRKSPQAVKFSDLARVCAHYFGEPRTRGSHNIYKTPWPGDPRINIQDDKGRAKTYQVRQVLAAIDKMLEGGENDA